MTQVTFFQLATDGEQARLAHACKLVEQAHEQRQRCVVHCANQADAEAMDELLWQMPADRFIPHNLIGEGPQNGTPVEISWAPKPPSRKAWAINLSGELLAPNQFQQIFDYVPVEEAEKAAARTRYKQYQQAGCIMQFKPADNESNNG